MGRMILGRDGGEEGKKEKYSGVVEKRCVVRGGKMGSCRYIILR
jgi:hypothetical protein